MKLEDGSYRGPALTTAEPDCTCDYGCVLPDFYREYGFGPRDPIPCTVTHSELRQEGSPYAYWQYFIEIPSRAQEGYSYYADATVWLRGGSELILPSATIE